VACFVVVNPGTTEPTVEALRDYLTDHGVAIQKTPESVIPIDSLPMTATGKVQKHILREQAANVVKGDGVGARS
jgi:cyclohexanecarboxylate-CoA ligase